MNCNMQSTNKRKETKSNREDKVIDKLDRLLAINCNMESNKKQEETKSDRKD